MSFIFKLLSSLAKRFQTAKIMCLKVMSRNPAIESQLKRKPVKIDVNSIVLPGDTSPPRVAADCWFECQPEERIRNLISLIRIHDIQNKQDPVEPGEAECDLKPLIYCLACSKKNDGSCPFLRLDTIISERLEKLKLELNLESTENLVEYLNQELDLVLKEIRKDPFL